MTVVNRSDEKAGLENGDAFILVQRKNNNTHSTPTGLLREGDYTQKPSVSSIKRDVKKKVLPRPEAEKIFVSRSSPLSVSAPRFRSRGFALACLPFLWVSSFGGDDANRVLKLGKRTWSWSVNHGSIGGSWPIAISGYPRRHNV